MVWIEGEAGSGKTALVDAVVSELPETFVVKRAEADELAVDEPFALLSQFGARGDGGPLAAGRDVLRSWSAMQDDGPVAVVVEDLHWADPDSRAALLTATRRLTGDRVLVLVTSRPGVPDGWERLSLDARRCLRVDVQALSQAEVAELAAAHGVQLGERAAARLHAHTAGHALYVRTLLAELTPAQLTQPDGPLPAPRSLAATTVAVLAGLPPEARRLAMALAVVGRPASVGQLARVAAVERPSAVLDALSASGLVRSRPDGAGELWGFAHPLYRVAVYAESSPSTRQAMHRAAAAETGGREALAHRVAAADGPDAVLAADLAASAARAASAAKRQAAARDLLAASRVSTDREQADRWLLDALRLMLAEGRTARAAEHRRAAEACADAPRKDLVLGLLDWAAGAAQSAERALRAAAESTPEPAGEAGSAPTGYALPDVAGEAAVRLATVLYTTGRGDEAVAVAEQVLAGPLAPDLERQAWIALVAGEQIRAGAVAALARLAPRLPEGGEISPSDTDLLVVRGTMQFYAARPAAAADDLSRALRLVRDAPVGALEQLPRAHLQLAHSLVLTGKWEESGGHARLALGLIDEDRLVWMRSQVHSVLARLAGCVRGDWALAESHLAIAGEAAGELRSLEAAFNLLIVRAMLADAREEPGGVLASFAGLVDGRFPVPMSTSLGWWPMIVDAAIDSGDLDAAADLLLRLRDAAAARLIDLDAVVTGLTGRLAEARGNPQAALSAYERAAAAFGPNTAVLDQGKLLYRHGALLLAQGRRRAALDRLRAARDVFAGAAPYVARVEKLLEAVGVTAVSTGPVLQLTDRERDVVALVKQGMTNREVATQLYVTDKAVEYHLGNVYAKLGIRSRRKLRDLVHD